MCLLKTYGENLSIFHSIDNDRIAIGDTIMQAFTPTVNHAERMSCPNSEHILNWGL